MSTLTMKDVAPYFTQYQEKYSEKCELSIDTMEQIMATSSTEAEMLDAMHTAMEALEDVVQSNDVTGLAVVDAQPGSAYSYAVQMDAGLNHDLDVLGQAAIENKRGGAVIMRNLFRVYGEETVTQTWPKPGSYKPGQGKHASKRVGSNEPWDVEETTITKPDGSTSAGTKSFYSELVMFSPAGKALLDERDEAKKVIGDIKSSKPRASAAETLFTNRKGAIVRAVNLAQRMAFINSKTQMYCEVILEGDQVIASNKLIFIKDKPTGTKVDIITIGQLLAFKNVTEGASYTDIVGTKQRKTKAGTGPAKQETKVNSIDQYDEVTAAYATFWDKLLADAKATNALLTHLNATGSDASLLSLNTIANGIDGILSKPVFAERLKILLTTGDGSKRAALAEQLKSGKAA